MVEIINKLFKYAFANGIDCYLHTYDILEEVERNTK